MLLVCAVILSELESEYLHNLCSFCVVVIDALYITDMFKTDEDKN